MVRARRTARRRRRPPRSGLPRGRGRRSAREYRLTLGRPRRCRGRSGTGQSLSGSVHVPVKLYSATESKTVHFHEVHLEDGARIEHQRFCAKEDKEVPYKEVVKGYEVATGEYVVLDKDEIKAAAGGTGHVIEVEHFVCVADIDPVFYEKSYYLGVGGEGQGRLPPAARRARADGPGGGRALHVPQPRVRRGHPAVRRRARAAHAALRRRAGRRRRVRLRGAAPRRGGARGQDGRPAGRVAARGVPPRALRGRVPRGRPGRDQAQGGGQGDRAAGRGGR